MSFPLCVSPQPTSGPARARVGGLHGVRLLGPLTGLRGLPRELGVGSGLVSAVCPTPDHWWYWVTQAGGFQERAAGHEGLRTPVDVIVASCLPFSPGPVRSFITPVGVYFTGPLTSGIYLLA